MNLSKLDAMADFIIVNRYRISNKGEYTCLPGCKLSRKLQHSVLINAQIIVLYYLSLQHKFIA